MAPHDGGRLLRLPPWMNVHHLPEYGIHIADAAGRVVEGVAKEEAKAAAGEMIGASTRRRLSTRRRAASPPPYPASGIGGGYVGGRDDATIEHAAALAIRVVPRVSASNNKTKKDVALDSLFPPTAREIQCSVRYLSEAGARLVMEEVDDCARHCLKYSANARKRRRGGGPSRDGTRVEAGDMRRREDNREENLATLAEEIHDYFVMFQPDDDIEDDQDGEDAGASRSSALHSWRERQGTDERTMDRRDALRDLLLPEKYDPICLPMVCLKCLPNMLDRAMIIEIIASELSRRRTARYDSATSRPPRNDSLRVVAEATAAASDVGQDKDFEGKLPCVCVVRSTSDLVRQGHVIAEVLSQCISNDSRGGVDFASELQRQRKRMKSHHRGRANNGVLFKSVWSWTQSMVDWAGYTDMFDSIIVILEDPEKIPSPTLDSFFCTLASLRSNDGVPICVVVIDATPGGLGDRLSRMRDPSLRGASGGLAARDLFVPLPEVQLDLFVKRLFSSKCIPMVLWNDHRLLKHIQEVFRDCDNSIVSIATKLKSELRRYFSAPGAFIAMDLLNCKRFTTVNESRIKFLFGDEQCRKFLSSHLSSLTTTTMSSSGGAHCGHISHLLWRMQLSYLSHQICQRLNNIFNICPLAEIGRVAGTEFCTNANMRELLLLLGKVRRKVATWKYAPSDLSASLCQKLNEWIILAGEFAAGESSSNVSMARSLVENILAWACSNMSARIKLETSAAVQPRRDVAKALCTPMPDALMPCSLVHACRIAFQVFRSRVMSLSEWHEKYFDVVMDQDGQEAGSRNSNEAAFFFAVYELVHMGFVRKLVTGKRKEDAYEKVAIIWGNGG